MINCNLVIKAIRDRSRDFTVLEFGEHGLFSIYRSTLADKQAFGQVLLIKSFKHVFT